MTRGRNDHAHNHPRTTTAPPTAPRPPKIQQWAPPRPSAPPTTPYPCTPPLLGWGTRIRYALGHLMPWSSCIIATSLSPAFPLYCHLYRLSTTARTSPPPFSASGNPVVRSVSFPTLSIIVKMMPAPPLPFSPYHQRPDHDDNPRTVRFIAQDAHPFDDHPRHTLRLFLRPQCSLQWRIFFFNCVNIIF